MRGPEGPSPCGSGSVTPLPPLPSGYPQGSERYRVRQERLPMVSSPSFTSESPVETFLPVQEIFLPVHGYVKLSLPEISIIDHPAFQRLRRVRQLGLAHFVFPGGTHSRF